MAKILSISYDRLLLRTRELILRNDGYEVNSVVGFDEAMEVCGESFDLILLGHTIPQLDKQAIVQALRERGCNSPVLALVRQGEKPIPEAAREVEPDPKLVLEAVRSLLPG